MSVDTTRGTASPGHLKTGVPHTSDAAPGETLAPPPKLRRRPVLVAAAVILVCLGALVTAWAFTSSSTAQDVLAVRSTVHRGETITPDDLMTVRIGVDPALQPIPAAERNSVVGKRAAMDLSAGGLVTREDVTAAALPGKGQSIVGVSLSPAMMPALPLEAGDNVRIVTTPGEQGDVGTAEPDAITATVVGVRHVGDSGQTVVDVSVPATDAAQLAARAGTGKVALVLDSRER